MDAPAFEPELAEDDGGRTIRRLLVVSALFELVYLSLAWWEQCPDWQRELLRAKGRRLMARVLKPCHDCSERRKEVNRGIFEAEQYLGAQ